MFALILVTFLFVQNIFRVENKEREVKMENQVGKIFERRYIYAHEYLLVFCYIKRFILVFLQVASLLKLWKHEEDCVFKQ